MRRGFFPSEFGEGIISGLYTLLVLSLTLFLGVEILSYGVSGWKIYTAGEELMELMKAENGLDEEMEARFFGLAQRLNLSDLELTVEGTPKYVQRGEPLELRIQGSYTLTCLRPLGRQWAVPLRIKLVGLAHTYIRSLG